MQDTFQCTPELLCEFFNKITYETSIEWQWEQFKASKAPKKEWEIVAFRKTGATETFKEMPQSRGVYWNSACHQKPIDELLSDKEYEIFSVRRLSDDTVWTAQEKAEVWEHGFVTITGFEVCANQMIVKTNNGTYLLNALQKLPAPILTTVDGVDLYEGMEFWYFLPGNWKLFSSMVERKTSDAPLVKKCQIFSTPEAAEDYILNHKPVLSLNDVREAMPRYMSPGEVKAVTDKLTVLVKEKINQ